MTVTHGVCVKRFCVHLIVVVLDGEVEEDTKCEVNVMGVTETSLFSQPHQVPLLGRGLLGSVQGRPVFPSTGSVAGLLDNLVDLPLHPLDLVLGRLLQLPLEASGGRGLSGLVHGVEHGGTTRPRPLGGARVASSSYSRHGSGRPLTQS